MKPERQILLKQLKLAIERAHPHIHAPVLNDSAVYLNMIELRGYLDALCDALEANSHQAEASGSVYRGLRIGVDLYGRMDLCKKYCVELANALGRKDETKLRAMRVLRQQPLHLLNRTNYGDSRADKEEDREYFTQLDGLLTIADRYIEIMIAKWLNHFEPRYKGKGKPIELDILGEPSGPGVIARPTLPVKPVSTVQPALPLPLATPIQSFLPLQTVLPLQPATSSSPVLPMQPALPLPVKPTRKQYPMDPPGPISKRAP